MASYYPSVEWIERELKWTPPKYLKGDRVTIMAASVADAKAAQNGHGGWDLVRERMLGMSGVVEGTNKAGDVYVKMDSCHTIRRWNRLLVLPAKVVAPAAHNAKRPDPAAAIDLAQQRPDDPLHEALHRAGLLNSDLQKELTSTGALPDKPFRTAALVMKEALQRITNPDYIKPISDVLDQLAHLMPQPANYALVALTAILRVTGDATANKENLKLLGTRCLSWMQLLATYQKSLEQVRYQQIIGEFTTFLEDCKQYLIDCSNRSMIKSCFKILSDKARISRLNDQLDMLHKELMLTVSLETHGLTLEAVRAIADQKAR